MPDFRPFLNVREDDFSGLELENYGIGTRSFSSSNQFWALTIRWGPEAACRPPLGFTMTKRPSSGRISYIVRLGSNLKRPIEENSSVERPARTDARQWRFSLRRALRREDSLAR